MKQAFFFIAIIVIILAAAESFCAQPDVDRFMGKVTLGKKLKPDVKGRREIAAIASKIMKIKGSGTVRIRGDFPGAADADEYLLKSVFLGKEVEEQLKPLLKSRFQVFVMASKYPGENKANPNIVEIFFYPRELQVMESLEPQNELSPESQPQEAAPQGDDAVERRPERAEADNRIKDSKKMKNQQFSEDPALANELVKRAKARAAERARRQALESATPQ